MKNKILYKHLIDAILRLNILHTMRHFSDKEEYRRRQRILIKMALTQL